MERAKNPVETTVVSGNSVSRLVIVDMFSWLVVYASLYLSRNSGFYGNSGHFVDDRRIHYNQRRRLYFWQIDFVRIIFSSRNVDEKRAKCPVKTILGNFRRTIGIGSIEPTNFWGNSIEIHIFALGIRTIGIFTF